MVDYDDIYAEREEKRSDIFNRFKNLNPLHLGILLGVILLVFVYYALKSGKDLTLWIVLIIGIFIFLYALSSSKKDEVISWIEGKAIVKKLIDDDLEDPDGDLPRGRVTITNKGKGIPYESYNFYIIYFYIEAYETGIRTWYKARVRKTGGGNFEGWEEVRGDTTGKVGNIEHGMGGNDYYGH